MLGPVPVELSGVLPGARLPGLSRRPPWRRS